MQCWEFVLLHLGTVASLFSVKRLVCDTILIGIFSKEEKATLLKTILGPILYLYGAFMTNVCH